jgi:STAS domain
MATVQDLQDKFDEIMVPGQPVALDLAQLTFLDSSAIHCFIRACVESGHPVVLHNTSKTVRGILDLVGPEPPAWVFDGESGHGLTLRLAGVPIRPTQPPSLGERREKRRGPVRAR